MPDLLAARPAQGVPAHARRRSSTGRTGSGLHAGACCGARQAKSLQRMRPCLQRSSLAPRAVRQAEGVDFIPYGMHAAPRRCERRGGAAGTLAAEYWRLPLVLHTCFYVAPMRVK